MPFRRCDAGASRCGRWRRKSRSSRPIPPRRRKAFTEAGGDITAMQGVPASDNQVRAWVQGKLTLADLQQMLVRLEGSAPYLIIESLRISADAALETGRLDKLDVRLEASIPYLRAAS
jgi:hypothetical protein